MNNNFSGHEFRKHDISCRFSSSTCSLCGTNSAFLSLNTRAVSSLQAVVPHIPRACPPRTSSPKFRYIICQNLTTDVTGPRPVHTTGEFISLSLAGIGAEKDQPSGDYTGRV